MPSTFSYRTEVIDFRGLVKSDRHDVIHESMSAAGAEGWELVSVLPIQGLHGPESAILFFKRPDVQRESTSAARPQAWTHPGGARRVES